MAHALALEGIRKTFDGFLALDGAGFALAWGEVHALLGENGAGKSTLMNVAAGLYAPEAGTIAVDGRAVALGGPRDAAAHGIGMVHQHFKLVRPFTVAENLLLAGTAADVRGGYRARLRAAERLIAARAEALGFEIRPDARIDRLSVAERQRVEILKVLLSGARILILDEPTAVLTDAEAERLLSTVQRLAREGTAVVLVTHKISDVRRYADRVTVMRAGRNVATLDPAGASAEEIVRLTVGDKVTPPVREPHAAGAVTLRVRGLRTAGKHGARDALDGVTFEVRAGEIYGLAGVGGNGQTELACAIMGVGDAVTGEIQVEGVGDLATLPAHRRDPGSLAAIPADRQAYALAGSLAVAENYAVGAASAGRYGSRWRLRRRRMAEAARGAAQAFNVQGVRSVWQKAALLSGGNAQKLVLARELGKQPRLILAHSPSRGLDVRATAEVHARLLAARDAGAAVLLISEDLDEVLSLADRIGVMSRGVIAAEMAQPADRLAIGRAMVDHA